MQPYCKASYKIQTNPQYWHKQNSRLEKTRYGYFEDSDLKSCLLGSHSLNWSGLALVHFNCNELESWSRDLRTRLELVKIAVFQTPTTKLSVIGNNQLIITAQYNFQLPVNLLFAKKIRLHWNSTAALHLFSRTMGQGQNLTCRWQLCWVPNTKSCAIFKQDFAILEMELIILDFF